MRNVCIVGDGPSNKNINKDIPFVGANCFPRLVEWIKRLHIDYYVVVNSHTEAETQKILDLHRNGFKIVTLGANATQTVMRLRLPHFALPHPSGLNRQINDEDEILRELLYARSWIIDP